MALLTELATITVLDPACGSGNFLYLALVLLLDLWKEVSIFMAELDFPRLLPTPDVCPSPLQLHGIEKDVVRARTGADHHLDRVHSVVHSERLWLSA